MPSDRVGWLVDGSLVVAMVGLVVLRTTLASNPVLSGVIAALLVGLVVHRIFGWVESPQSDAGAAACADIGQPRHGNAPPEPPSIPRSC
jgi:hypothetical protein